MVMVKEQIIMCCRIYQTSVYPQNVVFEVLTNCFLAEHNLKLYFGQQEL